MSGVEGGGLPGLNPSFSFFRLDVSDVTADRNVTTLPGFYCK